MGFLAKLGSLFRKQEAELTPEEKAALEAVKAQIRERCRRFRSLLSANKRALETMSEMEEHLEGARPFGAEYVRAAGTRAATAVFQMIREINGLTKNAYPGLNDAFARISSRIEAVTAPKAHPAQGPLVLPLEQISLADIKEVGGKMANLGEVASGAGLPVPPGFAVTVSAYRRFLEENGLVAEIEKRIRATDMDSLDQLFQLSAGLQQAVQAAPLPAILEDAIWSQLEILVDRYPAEDMRLSLRSSAVGEDALGASFAGQYHTELNVHPDEVTSIWKEIVASKYTVAALSYRYQRGIPDEDAPMCVGVLKMVDAEAGGVAYSTDPVGARDSEGNDLVVLNAVPGLPAAVVDGGVTPDTWAFTRGHPVAFASKRISFKASRLDIDPESAMGMRVTRFSEEEGLKPSLTDEQAREVAQIALGLEEYYAEPQDVEWAIEKGPDGRERVVVLQSRPLQEAGRGGAVEAGGAGAGAEACSEDDPEDRSGVGPSPEACPAAKPEAQAGASQGPEPDSGAGAGPDAPQALEHASGEAPGAPSGPEIDPSGILCQGGVGVSRGTAVGPVFIARRDADMLSFPEGAILVVERAFPRWAPLLPRATGMVSEAGGMAGHLASVCREYRVPAVFGMKDACRLLEPLAKAEGGDNVATLDAGGCRVVKGSHPELGQAGEGLPKLMAGSPVMKMLERLAECVVPLHLLDPKSPDFVPEKCTSLHDLTRFCHEKSADFMFNGDAGLSERMGKQLKAGAKLQYWVVDMDRGFTRDVSGPVVDIKEIASTPMLALWDGMVAVPWAGPPMAASGFMSVVFESAMTPELEVTAVNAMAERNYFIVDADYMLLQARYGYHFCTVEATAGEEAQENFVSFQFKGGAADVARRKLRTRLIADVLLPWGFNCDVKGDSLFAVAEGFTAEETLLRTKLVGYLLLHTRQSDVIMADDGQRVAFRQKLEGDMKDIAEGRAGKRR